MVPNGWLLTNLEKLMEFKNGLNFTKKDSGELIKIVGVGDFKDFSELVETGHLETVNVSNNIKKDELLESGDLLFVRSNGNKELIGRCLFFPKVNEKLSFSGFTIRGRVYLEKAIPEYIAYFARSSLMKQQISKGGGGTNISNLSQQLLNNIVLLLPPLPEQKKIAQILSTWDKAITITEKLLANSEQQKKALMQQLLTGKQRFSKSNAHWKDGYLCDIAKISKGKALSGKDLVNGIYPVIAGGKASPYNHNKYTHENAITISASGAYAGYVSYHPYKIWASDCSVVTAKNDSILIFIYQLLTFLQEKIYSLQSGGAQPHIYPKDIGSLKIKIPSFQEQQEISSVLSIADWEIKNIKQKLNCLKQEKKALMQQLLTGKKRVKIAEKNNA
ncbi:TPA: restriction endonuclease subunit S [Legionella pneumophila]|nr:restriction endonuclease subunit S [Legionella pneumophila]HAU4041819.1 restriction endonuclease subunit S [Legionella pneumophila]HAU4054633.1 restriction endonuclease subunit S [Legionella pneumophila]HDU8241966.1 restriction endonuclease subunit S [Legionella pneumophila]HDU8251506.1 restriction endonuclease subunit S [Legionella pneumophila]